MEAPDADNYRYLRGMRVWSLTELYQNCPRNLVCRVWVMIELFYALYFVVLPEQILEILVHMFDHIVQLPSTVWNCQSKHKNAEKSRLGHRICTFQCLLDVHYLLDSKIGCVGSNELLKSPPGFKSDVHFQMFYYSSPRFLCNIKDLLSI